MKNVSVRLKQAREAKGWSQARLASASGLAQSTVGNIEAGTRQARGSLPELAKALDVSYEWLANGIGEMNATQAAPQQSATYSTEALALAWLLDQIHNRLDKTIANNAATAAVLEVLQRSGAKPTHTQERRVIPKIPSA
jgi:transcriptional regulator with XRE-family HTH domain